MINDVKSVMKLDTQMKIPEDSTKEELEAKKMSLIEECQDIIGSWKCTVCGKKAKTKYNMKMHIEIHLEGLSYPCNQCGKVSRSSNALIAHVSTFHRK